MREAIGGTWLFQIVIVFVLLFAGYICLSINYSRAYKVKNEVVDIIERRGTLDYYALASINQYLNDAGYYSIGTCPSDMSAYKANLLDPTDTEYISGSMTDQGNYCISKVLVNGEDETNGGISKVYYKVRVFFKFDLPIFGDIFSFKLDGETEQLINK